jgi:putative ATP-binding cassette transporter
LNKRLFKKGLTNAFDKAASPWRKLRDAFSIQAAIDEGFSFKPKPIKKLSPEKRKELMAASSLETPRSKTRSVMGVFAPYVTQSSTKEKVSAFALLGTALFLNKFSVDMMVDFGNWLSTLTNTVAQLWQITASSRPEAIAEIIDNYPLVQEALTNTPLLNEMLMHYPDVTQILQDQQFQDMISQSPELAEVLQKNPTMEDLLMQHPEFVEKVAANPELLEQVTEFKNDLGDKLRNLPSVKGKLKDLWHICFGAFAENTSDTVKSIFNDNSTSEAADKLWKSKDLTTIALKFTASAIASYKAAQYLVLRWRAWSTGYYTNKFTNDGVSARLKNKFTNIDNPGQRLQEDPDKFTAASVSLLTGVASSAITLQAFSGMLWGMGPVMGVKGGFFWIGAAYASTVMALTAGAGYKLPWIYRNKQRVEANLRRTTDNIHNNAEQIVLTKSEETEKELVKKQVRPVMKNSLKEIGTQVKLIVVDATIGNVSIPLPYLVASFSAVAAGTASFGTVQTLNYAFNRVNSSLSFIVNRFEQISNWIATSQRMHGMDKAMDAARYIEWEKREAQQAKSGSSSNNINKPPAGP